MSAIFLSDMGSGFTINSGHWRGLAVVALYIVQHDGLEFFGDTLAAQRDGFFTIDKNRRRRRFSGAGQDYQLRVRMTACAKAACEYRIALFSY